MVSKLRLVRNVNQSRRIRFVVLLVGCFVVTMTFLVVSKPKALVLYNFGFRSSSPSPPSPPSTPSDVVNGGDKRDDSAAVEREGEKGPQVLGTDVGKEEKLSEEKKTVVDSTSPEEEFHEFTETSTEGDGSSAKADADHGSSQESTHDRLALPTVSNYSINDRTQADTTVATERLGQQIQAPERKPLCDVSDRRTDICEMFGDVRIPGNTSSVIFMESSQTGQNEVWQIRPYPRKGDEACLQGVRQVTVKASSEAPECSANHDVPAIVFSIGGYSGNLFHDFGDVLVPLFTTARQFDGEVQFVITDSKSWWTAKFLPVLQKLSKYPLIDFGGDNQVHCFKQVIVGLRAHSEFHIEPRRAPNGYTMVDFTKFMRSAFSLGRETLPTIEDLSARKPRLLIISRKQSRTFTNIDKIVQEAEEMGFEVVVDEADVSSGLAQFAQVVNSCDVMMGVHGTGLANMVFLPQNATVIQIVPWGGLEWIATSNYGDPAKAMGLNYVEYSISMEESTLTEKYPKDHPVFTDPLSFHNRGYQVMRSTFMDNQNVKLDVHKFRDVLWKTLELLIQ